MRKLNLSTPTFPALLILALMLVTSCARSPYNFVKVEPKRPIDRVAPVNTFTPGRQTIHNVSGEKAPAVRFSRPGGKHLAPRPAAAARNGAYLRKESVREQRTGTRGEARRQAKEDKAAARKVVERELSKSAAFSALPAKKLEKVEKIISKQAAKIAKKKAAAPAGSIGFNQWMKIGVILLLVGLVVGIAFADLGYIVAVIGVVFLVLGLIQQL